MLVSTDLVENVGILTGEAISQFSIGQLQLLLRNPISEAVEEHMDKIFSLQQNSVIPNAYLSIGKGYNILGDEMKPMAIFKMDKSTYQKTPYGISIPKGISMQTVRHTATFMEHFEEEASYVNQRLRQLNLNMEVDATLFNMKTRGGYSRQVESNKKMRRAEHSFLYEHRLFKLEIPDWTDLALTDGFKKSVTTKLPNTYNKDDSSNRREFEDFFNTWGHCIIASAFGGGTVEVKSETIGVEKSDSSQVLLNARAELETSFHILSAGFECSQCGPDQGSERYVCSTRNPCLLHEGHDTRFYFPNCKTFLPTIQALLSRKTRLSSC